MLMSDVLMWVAIASGFIVGMPALWMLNHGLWPESFAKRCEVAHRGVGKSLLMGLIPLAVAIFIITLMAKRLGPVPAILLSGSVFIWGMMGTAGIAKLVGERLWPHREPVLRTRNGGLVVICCALLPVVGWFLILPLIAIIGMGVNVRCLTQRNSRAVDSQAQAIPSAVETPIS